jgi:hypothetical protein
MLRITKCLEKNPYTDGCGGGHIIFMCEHYTPRDLTGSQNHTLVNNL